MSPKIRGAREIEPMVVLQPAGELRAEQTAFRYQMSAPLAAKCKVRRVIGTEKDYGFGCERAIFRGSQTENIDTGFPGDIGGFAADADDCIGEAGTIHVDRKAARTGHVRQRCDFIGRVHEAAFASLRNTEDRRLHIVWDIVRQTIERVDCKSAAVIFPASFASERSTGIRRAPPVKNSGAEHSSSMMCAWGWHSTAFHGWVKAESASEFAAVPLVTKKAVRFMLEYVGEQAFGFSRPRIGSIGWGDACVRIYQCVQHTRGRASHVVAAEVQYGDVGHELRLR